MLAPANWRKHTPQILYLAPLILYIARSISYVCIPLPELAHDLGLADYSVSARRLCDHALQFAQYVAVSELAETSSTVRKFEDRKATINTAR